MKLRNFILIIAFTISSFSILVSGKPSSRRLKNQRNKEAEEGIAKNDAASAASVVTPSTGSLSSSNVSVSSLEDSVLTLPTSAVKSKKLKKSHRLKHRRFGHHHKKHNRRSHNHRGGNRRHHNSTKHDDPISSAAHNVTSSELPSALINREQADIPSLKLLRSSRSGHRKFKRHHHNHHHRPQNRRPSKRVKEQLAGENKGE